MDISGVDSICTLLLPRYRIALWPIRLGLTRLEALHNALGHHDLSGRPEGSDGPGRRSTQPLYGTGKAFKAREWAVLKGFKGLKTAKDLRCAGSKAASDDGWREGLESKRF